MPNILRFTAPQVQPADTLLAQRRFKQLAKNTAADLPTTRLLSLLGDSQRRQTQSLSENELKAKKQLMTEGEVSDELVGKAGLVYYPEEELKSKQRVKSQVATGGARCPFTCMIFCLRGVTSILRSHLFCCDSDQSRNVAHPVIYDA